MCVCMFQHNSGTPGAISAKLGTHMTHNLGTKIVYSTFKLIWTLLQATFDFE